MGFCLNLAFAFVGRKLLNIIGVQTVGTNKEESKASDRLWSCYWSVQVELIALYLKYPLNFLHSAC